MTLDWTLYSAFAGVAALLLVPRADARRARWVALATAVAGLACAVIGTARLPDQAGVVTLVKVPWVSSLGLEFHLAADGISVTLVWLTALAALAGVAFSWNVTHRTREFFALYFGLIGATYGVFLSFDLFLLFVFYELAIIPKYFLIAIWGSTRREYGAMKLVLYSFVGSALVLFGLVALFVLAGSRTMDLNVLARHAFPETFQVWAFPLIFIGFGVLAGLWPFHTWAPTGHVAAPTAASMLLAGVIMKLGAYGALRVAVALLPEGLRVWAPAMGLLAVVGIVSGALVALVQRDLKFVIGYSSVSHMGFVLLGLVSLSLTGLSGAVLQMFSHGIIAGLLFGVVGRMVYDRTHTRELDTLAALRLGRALPFAGVTFALAAAASMGMPGFSGFVAELQVVVGTWKAFPGYVLLAGLGILLGAAYSLRALQQAFYAEEQAEVLPGGSGPAALDPITAPERLGAVLLLVATLAVGLYPRWLLDWIEPALASEYFEGLRRVLVP
jgi:NADH-quinone oxidoreductase subunit M